jgi:hypothetical protein
MKLTQAGIRDKGLHRPGVGVRCIQALAFMERTPRTMGEIRKHLGTERNGSPARSPLPRMESMWQLHSHHAGDAERLTLTEHGKQYLLELRASGFDI